MNFLGWFWARLKGAFNRWVEGLITAGAVGLAFLIWGLLRDQIRSDVALPTWIFALILGLGAAIILILLVRLKTHRGHILNLTGGVERIADLALETEQLRAMTGAYAEHLGEMLYALQRVLGGVIPGVTPADFIEEGILQPARDLLRSRQEEDVRLSILVPEGADFVMPYAAGHTLESKRSFRLPIDTSFSKWAFNNGLIYWSGDLANDPRFTRHPRAAQERAYDSMISVPVRRAGTPVAVFNTIFEATGAFDDADLIYVRLVGAVVELVWELGEL